MSDNNMVNKITVKGDSTDSPYLIDLSIIVPTIDAGDRFNRTLHSLSNSIKKSATSLKIELIIVDNSQKPISNIARASFTEYCKVFHLIQENRVPATRNFHDGLIQANGRWSVFLAIDDRLNLDFFINLIQYMNSCLSTNRIAIMPALVTTHRRREFKDYQEASYYYRAPVGWFIYSVVVTDEFKKIFRGHDCTHSDWFDYYISAEISRMGLLDAPLMSRYYDVPKKKYKINANRRFLNPIPIISYLLTHSATLLLKYPYCSISTVRWCSHAAWKSVIYNIKLLISTLK